MVYGPTIIDCLGTTSEIDGELDNEGPNMDERDLEDEENDNNIVNPHSVTSTLS